MKVFVNVIKSIEKVIKKSMKCCKKKFKNDCIKVIKKVVRKCKRKLKKF